LYSALNRFLWEAEKNPGPKNHLRRDDCDAPVGRVEGKPAPLERFPKTAG
jgi:hypothetical protein